MGGKRRLKAAKPRRYPDHRVRDAKRWSEHYDTVAARYEPKDKLDRQMVAIAADLFLAYEDIMTASKATRQKKASAARKSVGLILGTLRVLSRNGTPDHPSLEEFFSGGDE